MSLRVLVVSLALLAVAPLSAQDKASDSLPGKDRPLKVLMIGNSFSICCLWETPQIAEACGRKLDLASLYIGGCSLERHWNNVVAATNSDFRPYRYDRITEGKRVVEKGASNIPEALTSDAWDVVTIQQCSHLSWDYSSYHPFGDDLVETIRGLAPQAKILVQETWSYPPWDKRLNGFAKVTGVAGFDHAEMYRRLRGAYADFAAGHGLEVIPTGTAAEYCPDRNRLFKEPDFHFNKPGIYLQGLVWTAKLFGVDVRSCSYVQEGLDEAFAEQLKTVAMQAVRGEIPAASAEPSVKAPKNVILFIGDGMSIPQRMTAEEFSRKIGKGSLAMNSLPCSAMTRSCSADSLVTDSAAAATAIACGEKTNNHALGVDAQGQPVYSCALAAKKLGKKVGICSTVTITHATPGGFYAHRLNRGENYGIALDLVHSGFDFFAGGGLELTDAKQKASPEFAKYGDAYEYAWKKGYKKVSTRDEFLALKPGCGKVLTYFTNGPLDFAIDAKSSSKQPNVAEITAKAIEVLDNEKGFFLMVEGGRIDWAGHSNDAATNLRDVLALDEAVKVALDFQKNNPDTLVLVTGDHETGGMSMGFAGTGYALFLENLAKQTMSVSRFDSRVAQKFKELKTPSFADVIPLVAEAFGLALMSPAEKGLLELSDSERHEIRAAFEHDVAFYKHNIGENPKYDGEKRYLFGSACRLVLAHKSGLGWSTNAHTAMPVLTTAQGPCAEQFTGFIENTDISRKIKAFYR